MVKKGGIFLVEESKPEEVFIPEEFTEEQRMFAKTAEDFIRKEVLPKSDEIEKKNYDLHLELFRKAGELGLLGVEVPEEYGGLGLDKISAMLVSEKMSGGQSSFATTVMAHTGIGTLPLLYFGTEEQKQKYLPKLATGEWVGAYALTETNAGSDAMNIKTKAVRDGDYWILNGSKQFITNSRFANLFTVYAKVDGDKMAAFLVERNTEGFSIGPEEHKMGIHGSSTCPLYFDNAKVPKENLLGGEEWIGKGHLIAFNVLNIGRYKLAMACLGSSKVALEEAVKYTNQRQQFGQPISNFDMIKEKIARMATKIWALESASYRTAGLIDEAFKEGTKNPID
ncbi:MAG: acyl-CoA dehydrogenase family protein, partial [candidate division WOR-3 bacterium]